jgi:hypothetical protein
MNTWWIWVAPFLGSLIGIAGGLVGTYFSIRNTRGPRERAFMIRAAILCWLLVTAFLAAYFLIPTWHRHLVVPLYGVLLVLGIRWCNRSQARIRQEEAADAE